MTTAAATRPKISLAGAVGVTVVALSLLLPAIASGVFASINVMLMFALAWYGWMITPDRVPAVATRTKTVTGRPADQIVDHVDEPAAPPVRLLVPEADPLTSIDRDIMRSSRLVEDDQTITALHRFRRTLDGLMARSFHDDVARELDMIVERNFPDLIEHYVSARKQAAGEQGIEADRILGDSIRHLTTRLGEIADSQRRIDTDRLREHGDYLRNRHPVENDDPFSRIRGPRS